MSADRILGGAAVAFGGFLLLVAIPRNVVSTGGLTLNPALFPQLAAWLFILLGALQMLFPAAAPEMPTLRECGRLLVAAAATLACLLLMPAIGFPFAMIVLSAAMALLSRERRLVWLATTVLVLPLGVWSFFELVLGRPLP